MSGPDLNLLATLDAVLSEGSVARAARRLRLSPSAMSRALARLRAATGDPLLVRAGRALVLTPRALELRGRVGRLVEETAAVLRPTEGVDLARLDRVFTIRAREGIVETIGAALIARVAAEAPRVRLCFVPKPDKDPAALREGSVDFETGVVDDRTGREIRSQLLFTDRFVAVVRAGHALARGALTPARFARARHVAVSRGGPTDAPVDDALAAIDLGRDVVAVVAGFSAALAVARASDFVVCVPDRHTAVLRDGLVGLALPFAMPTFSVSLLWHPRHDADAAHRWLRELMVDVFAPIRRNTLVQRPVE